MQMGIDEMLESLALPSQADGEIAQSPSEESVAIRFPNSNAEKEKLNTKPPLDFSKFPKVRNREEARAFEKILRKSGKGKDEIADIIKLSKMLAKAYDSEMLGQYRQSLRDGDMAKLNIDRMRSYPDWDKRQEAYREFVDANVDSVFTVKLHENYPGSIVRLIDDDGSECKWLFSDKDLLIFDAKDSTYNEIWLIEEEKN